MTCGGGVACRRVWWSVCRGGRGEECVFKGKIRFVPRDLLLIRFVPPDLLFSPQLVRPMEFGVREIWRRRRDGRTSGRGFIRAHGSSGECGPGVKSLILLAAIAGLRISALSGSCPGSCFPETFAGIFENFAPVIPRRPDVKLLNYVSQDILDGDPASGKVATH